MITLFWTLLFCDGTQAITYVSPQNNANTDVVYAYVAGTADSVLYFPATELFVCGHWITLEN